MDVHCYINPGILNVFMKYFLKELIVHAFRKRMSTGRG